MNVYSLEVMWVVWVRGPCRCGFGPHAWVWMPEPYEVMPYPYGWPSPSDEREALERELKVLEERVGEIKKRLEELKG